MVKWRLKVGGEYTLIHPDGRVFKGRLIVRNYVKPTDFCFSGFIQGERHRCHMPLKSAISHGWGLQYG